MSQCEYFRYIYLVTYKNIYIYIYMQRIIPVPGWQPVWIFQVHISGYIQNIFSYIYIYIYARDNTSPWLAVAKVVVDPVWHPLWKNREVKSPVCLMVKEEAYCIIRWWLIKQIWSICWKLKLNISFIQLYLFLFRLLQGNRWFPPSIC